MLNFDNAFWALTAMENFGVLMWAFWAIAFYCWKGGVVRRSMSWGFAILAVLTSAQGLAVLGAMILISLVPDGDCGSWRDIWRNIRMRPPYRTVVVVVLSTLVSLLYFRGFSSGSAAEAVVSASVIDKVLYYNFPN